MLSLTLAEVAEATGGVLAGGADPAVRVTADAVVDSRLVVAGALFVALPGERADGADFAAAAIAAGAVAVLCGRALELPCVVTADPVAALGRLASAVLRRLPSVTVVGLTGSSGKTSTKDLLAEVLPRLGETVATRGSFNNEIGLPLTVLRCTPDTRYLVVEMGARGRGHIAALCAVAPPEVGLVLNVGSAHVGEFGGRDAVAAAKGELVEALPAGGTAVLNADDDLVRPMAGRAGGGVRVVTFGRSASADVRAEDVVLDDGARAGFTLVARGSRTPVQLGVVGEHAVDNALAAAAAALTLGLAPELVARALSAARPRSRWRMEVSDTARGVTVLNDAYNANPESVRAALKALVTMTDARRRAAGGTDPGDASRARRPLSWAVLGEMLELGDVSLSEHDAIGRLAVRLRVDRLVVVGEATRPLYLGAVLEGSWGDEATLVASAEEAAALVGEQAQPGDVVLVKASRSIGLERVAAALLDGGSGVAA